MIHYPESAKTTKISALFFALERLLAVKFSDDPS
jgi:hypothetical protein